MGQPDILNRISLRAEYIGAWTRTQGSETSQYLQEQKSSEIPSVAASERGRAQTGSSDRAGVVGLSQGFPGKLSRFALAEGPWKGRPEWVIVP